MKFFEIIFILLILLPIALLMRFFVSKLSAQTPMQRRTAPEEVKPKKKRKPIRFNLPKKKRDKDLDEDYEAYEDYGEYEGSRAEPARRQAEPARRQSAPYRDQDTPYRDQDASYRNQDTPSRRPDTPYRDQGTAYRNPKTSGSGAAASSSTTRRHTELKRTQRIPFSELYGTTPPSGSAPSGGSTYTRRTETYSYNPQSTSQQSVSDSVAKRVSDRRAAAKNAPRSEQEPSKRQKRRNRERARKRELARRDKENKE